MATPLTFTQALERAAEFARHQTPAAAHERLSAAVALVKEGAVVQDDQGHWEVRSTSEPGKTYSVNGSCPCPDSQYRGVPCKHRYAVRLAKLASTILAEAPQAPKLTDSVSLPEAPSSVNFKAMIGGFEAQVTLRDTDDSRLLARLQSLLKDPRIQPIPMAAPRSQGQQWKQRRAYQGA